MIRFSLFMICMMAATASFAGGASDSQCASGTVPVEITDKRLPGGERNPSGERNPPFPYGSSSEPLFRACVSVVTQHIANWQVRKKLCLPDDANRKLSLLQFVAWPVAFHKDISLAPIPSLDALPSGGCRVTSPWLDLVYERKPVPRINAVVRWNARQFLADQAVLAGAPNVPKGVAMPLTADEFWRMSGEYELEILEKHVRAQPIAIQQEIEAKLRVPPDILWLFNHSGSGRNLAFGWWLRGPMDRTIKKSAENYTLLVTALIDRCFASNKADLRYNSILDAADLISLERYKIDGDDVLYGKLKP